jgi:hypothetical protein
MGRFRSTSPPNQLALIVSLVEMSFGFADQACFPKPPLLVASDENRPTLTAWTSVGSDQRPLEYRIMSVHAYVIQGNDHIGKRRHEGLRCRCDSHTALRWRPAVNLKGALFLVKCSHACGAPTAPGSRISPTEVL